MAFSCVFVGEEAVGVTENEFVEFALFVEVSSEVVSEDAVDETVAFVLFEAIPDEVRPTVKTPSCTAVGAVISSCNSMSLAARRDITVTP